MSISGLVIKFMGCPATSASRLHIGHSPDNFGDVVIKRFQAQMDVGPTGGQEGLSSRVASVKFQWSRRFEEVPLPACGRSRYRQGLSTVSRGQSDLGWCILGLWGADSVKDILWKVVPVDGLVLAFNFIHCGFKGKDTTNMDGIINYIER